jgi:hypothetical protein
MRMQICVLLLISHYTIYEMGSQIYLLVFQNISQRVSFILGSTEENSRKPMTWFLRQCPEQLC